MRARAGHLAAALGVIMVISIGAGCGSSSDDSTSTSSSASTAAATTGASTGASTTASADGPKRGTAEETTELITKVYGVPTEESSLPPTVLESLQVASAPNDAALMEKFMSCLGKAVCETGYEGADLTIGLPIDDTTNPINRQGQAISLLQTLRYPNVKKILLPDGQGDVQKINSNFRSLLSQDVDAIIGNFGNGATMAAVGKQAQQQGVVIAAQNQNIAGQKPGDTYIFTGNELCQYGDFQGQAAIDGTKKESGGTYYLLTGTPGNPYGAAWQPCTKKFLDGKGWKEVGSGTTNWTPQGNAQAASAIISGGKNPDAILYDADCTQLVKSYLDAGKQAPMIAGAGVAPSCVKLWDQATKDGKPFPAYTGNAQVWNYNVGVTAAIDRVMGKEGESNIVLALPLIPFDQLVKNEPDWATLPAAATFQSTLPIEATEKLLGGS